jgi:hypothetical protein
MKSSSDNSFIPKRGAAKKTQSGAPHKIYIVTYISYVLMFATLLSAGGLYFYAQYTSGQLDAQVSALNSEISSFSQADMERITQFNVRLSQAQDRLDNSISVTSVFEALQAATIDTIQIKSLAMEREGDNRLVIEGDIQTDSFDSTIFQRGVFLRNGTIQEVEISDVQNTTVNELSETEQEQNSRPAVTFTASLSIPLEEIPANPLSYQGQTADFNEPAPAQPAEQDTSAESNNEDIL